MDPNLKEVPENQDVKKKKKKNKKKKNKNKENVQGSTTGISTAPETQPQPATQNGKAPTTKMPPVHATFAEDELLPNINTNTKSGAAVPPPLNFNLDQPAANEPEKEATEGDDSEDEGIADYKLGGYHPVHIGEVLLERYVVIQKLGWGHFSTVWLCKDFKYDTYVAIKIQKSAPHYLEAAYDEVEILQRVAKNTNNPEWLKSLKGYYKDEGRTKFTKDDCHVVQLLNSFIYQGPYGNHFCMVFEIMGVNLLEVIKRYNYRGVPMPLCRRLAKQILIGLDYLHRMCGVIHTDLKPENILICLTKQETKDIVENGQLSRTQKYQERIQEYQASHGIKIDAKSKPKTAAGGKPTVQTDNKGQDNQPEQPTPGTATGKGKNKKKKNQKRRRKEKAKKKQDEDARLMEYGYAPEDLDDETRLAILLEIQERDGLAAEEEDEVSDEEAKVEEPRPEPTQAKPTEVPAAEQEGEAGGEGEKGRGPKLDENFRIKIVDLGNACWTHHHFTSKIQTRQYRSPEVILGLHYDTSADIWSFACTIFEMLTGDFLFEPRKGHNFGKNDDHFAQVIELLKLFPKKYVQAGKNFKKFFDKSGGLRRIQGFHYWPLKNVLTDKYQMKPEEAEAFASFILPMLEYYPLRRASAQKMLSHYWMKMPPINDIKMTEEEYNAFIAKRQATEDGELEHETYVEPEDNDADDDGYASGEDDEDGWYNEEHDYYGYKHLMNKSYDNGVYTGYADGIIVDELDKESNWQFKKHK